MPQSLSVFDAALKEDYTPGLQEAVNQSNVILSVVKKNTDDIVGRQAVWAVHHARSASTGARAELGTLPSADAQRFEDPRENLKYSYHTIKVSGPAIALTRNDKGAFRRALEAEMTGAENDIKNNLSRQVIAGRYTVQTATPTVGRTGVLAIAQAGTFGGADPIDLDTATTNAEMRFFFVGQKVDVVVVATGVVTATRNITAVDKTSSPKTITVDGADDIVVNAGDIIVVSGSYGNEFAGLPVLVNDNIGDKVDGTNVVQVHNLSSGSVPAWASAKVGSTTTPISEDLIEQAFDAIETDGNGDSDAAKILVGSFEQRRTLANKLQAQKRYDGREVTLKAGWRGLNIARGTYVAERYCLDNDLFLINPSALSWFVGQDLTFDDVDGKVLFKALDGSDAFEARMKIYCALAALTRNAHCRVKVQAV